MHRNGTKGIPALIEPRRGLSYLQTRSICKRTRELLQQWANLRSMVDRVPRALHICLLFLHIFLWASPWRKGTGLGFSFLIIFTKKKKASVVKVTEEAELKERNCFLVSFLFFAEGQFSMPWDSGRAPLFSKYTLPSVGKSGALPLCWQDRAKGLTAVQR